MLTNKEIAIYALGKTEGINSLAETLGTGFDDKKYIESWNKTMKLLGINMSLKDLEKIYEEFSKKMDEVLTKDELKSKKSKTKS
jgi:proteasome assembly chaperone (PAC2) family protein